MPNAPVVVCIVPNRDAELLSALLFGSGATAIAEVDRADMIELRSGFADVESARAAAALLPDRSNARVELVADDRWQATQRGGFAPVRAGPFEVRPSWHRSPADAPDDHLIVIDPEAAFGHGGHPSTRLLLAIIGDLVDDSMTVVDLGTGTGVLAIAAALRGAHVLAVDNDPGAVETARRNVRRNGLEPLIEVRATSEITGPLVADVAVVNVTLGGHREVHSALDAVPIVAASGLLDQQVEEVRRLYGPRRSQRVDSEEGWSAVVLA